MRVNVFGRKYGPVEAQVDPAVGPRGPEAGGNRKVRPVAAMLPVVAALLVVVQGVAVAPAVASAPQGSDSAGSGEDGARGRHGTWSRLGGDLLAAPATQINGLSLAAGRAGRPVLSVSRSGDSGPASDALRWTGRKWVRLGPSPAASGGSVTVDRRGRTWWCTGPIGGAARRGPVVFRWVRGKWVQLGGDVAVEAGYAEGGRRYIVHGCSGPVIDPTGAPVVVWVAHVGSKAHFVFAARWDAGQGRWVGLDGPRIEDSRATTVYADMDDLGRLYVATHKPGRGYGGRETSKVFRWDGGEWTQLGEGWEETDQPALVAGGHEVYVAYRVQATGQVEVARWTGKAWRSLPGLGSSGPLVALELSGRGRLVAATAPDPESSADGVRVASSADGVRVAVLRGGAWHTVGGSASGPLAGGVVALTLTLDGADRPTVAWGEYLDGVYSVHAAGCHRPSCGG